MLLPSSRRRSQRGLEGLIAEIAVRVKLNGFSHDRKLPIPGVIVDLAAVDRAASIGGSGRHGGNGGVGTDHAAADAALEQHGRAFKGVEASGIAAVVVEERDEVHLAYAMVGRKVVKFLRAPFLKAGGAVDVSLVSEAPAPDVEGDAGIFNDEGAVIRMHQDKMTAEALKALARVRQISKQRSAHGLAHDSKSAQTAIESLPLHGFRRLLKAVRGRTWRAGTKNARVK